MSSTVDKRGVRFPMIDSVRALAACWVIAYHCGYLTNFVQADTVVRPFLDQAGTAAMIFFLVSGFLLYRPFAIARLAGRPIPSPVAYLWRRILRIVPGYWVALTVIAFVLGVHAVGTRSLTAGDIPRYYGFAQIYTGDLRVALGGIPQAWTLCVEMSFYLFMPVWALAMARVPGRSERSRALVELALLFLVFCFSVGYKIWLSARIDPGSLTGGPKFMPLPNYLDAFALGMGLGIVSAWNERQGVLSGPIGIVRRWPTLSWVAAAVVLWTASTQFGFTGNPSQHFTRRMWLERWELQVLAGTLLLLPTFFGVTGRGLVGRVLARRRLIWLGIVSYGVYLYHYALIEELKKISFLPHDKAVRFWILFALALPLAAAIAALSYYGIERPLLRLKRLVRTGAPVTGEALAEPAPEAAGARNPASMATAASTTNEISAG